MSFAAVRMLIIKLPEKIQFCSFISVKNDGKSFLIIKEDIVVKNLDILEGKRRETFKKLSFCHHCRRENRVIVGKCVWKKTLETSESSLAPSAPKSRKSIIRKRSTATGGGIREINNHGNGKKCRKVNEFSTKYLIALLLYQNFCNLQKIFVCDCSYLHFFVRYFLAWLNTVMSWYEFFMIVYGFLGFNTGYQVALSFIVEVRLHLSFKTSVIFQTGSISLGLCHCVSSINTILIFIKMSWFPRCCVTFNEHTGPMLMLELMLWLLISGLILVRGEESSLSIESSVNINLKRFYFSFYFHLHLEMSLDLTQVIVWVEDLLRDRLRDRLDQLCDRAGRPSSDWTRGSRNRWDHKRNMDKKADRTDRKKRKGHNGQRRKYQNFGLHRLLHLHHFHCFPLNLIVNFRKHTLLLKIRKDFSFFLTTWEPCSYVLLYCKRVIHTLSIVFIRILTNNLYRPPLYCLSNIVECIMIIYTNLTICVFFLSYSITYIQLNFFLKETSGSFVCDFSFTILSVIAVKLLISLSSCLFTTMAICGVPCGMLFNKLHTRTYIRTHIQFNCNNHKGLLKLRLLGGDIELNPGPVLNEITIMSQNCRGLNDRQKFSYLLKNKNSKTKNKVFILALQETYLVNEQLLQWSGNYAFTKAESVHSAEIECAEIECYRNRILRNRGWVNQRQDKNPRRNKSVLYKFI